MTVDAAPADAVDRALADQPTPVERTARTAVLLAAVCGYAGSSVLLRQVAWDALPIWAWCVCVAALVVLPYASAAFVTWISPRLPRPWLARVLAFLVEMLPVLVFAKAAPIAALPALLVLGQGRMVVGSRGGRWSGASLALTMYQVVAAFAFAPGWLSTALLVGAVGATVSALALLRAAALARRASQLLERRSIVPEGDTAVRRRLFSTAILTMLVLACAAGVVGTIGVLTPATEEERAAAQRIREKPREIPRDVYQQEVAGALDEYQLDMEMASGLPQIGDDDFLMVRVVKDMSGRKPGRPLLLRTSTLDEIDGRGIRQSDLGTPPLFQDPDDGEPDGWTTFAEGDEPRDLVELEISQPPVPLTEAGWNLLTTHGQTHAVRLPEARFDPDRFLFQTSIPTEDLTYSVRGSVRTIEDLSLSTAEAKHEDARWTQFPDETRLSKLATKFAYSIDQLESDQEKVRAILKRFDEMEYDVSGAQYSGTTSLGGLLHMGSGNYQDFAAAALTTLRMLELPSRIATGFRAHRYNPDTGVYTVQRSDIHAWIEVYFDGVGWVSVDPTPSQARSDALEDPLITGRTSPFDWLDDQLAGATGLTGPVAYAILGGILVLLFGVLALVFLILRNSRSRAARARLATQVEGRRIIDYAFLLRLLARRGHVKRAAETPREFAHEVVRREGDPFQPFEGITESFYLARFGGAATSDEELSEVETFVDSIKGGKRPETSGGDGAGSGAAAGE